MQAFVAEFCGSEIKLDSDASVLNYRDAAGDSHGCPIWFLEDMARYFDLDWNYQRWIVYLKLPRQRRLSKQEQKKAWERWKREVAPLITIRSIAALIARRAVAPSFEPLKLFGRPCAPAGIFTGLAGLPETREMRIGPSTKLRLLRQSDRLGRLWQRALWITGASLPQLNLPRPHRWPTVIGWVLISCWVSAGIALISMVGGHDPRPQVWFLPLMMFTCLSPLAAIVGQWLDGFRNPLPNGVQTFGDLARLIAAGERPPR